MKKSQKRIKSTNEEIIKQCFDVFDQDRNGLITESEFIVKLIIFISSKLSLLFN